MDLPPLPNWLNCGKAIEMHTKTAKFDQNRSLNVSKFGKYLNSSQNKDRHLHRTIKIKYNLMTKLFTNRKFTKLKKPHRNDAFKQNEIHKLIERTFFKNVPVFEFLWSSHRDRRDADVDMCNIIKYVRLSIPWNLELNQFMQKLW